MIIRTQIAEYLDQPPVMLFQDSDFYDRTVELILALSGGGGGTVTSVAATGGTGISITGSPITTSGNFTITNTAPDQVVSISSGTAINVTGTYPNFTITNTAPATTSGTVTSIATTAPITGGTITTTGTIGITQSTTSTDGYLSSADWNLFAGKQPQLNGTGFVKAAGTTISYDNSTYVPTSRTVNGHALSANVTITADDVLPTQTGHSGEFLTTNGTTASWAAVSGSGTVTSVDLTPGTGISVSGGPITTSGSITVTNDAPDLTVVLTDGTGISVTGTYPNFTITNTAPSTITPSALSKVDDVNVTLTLGGAPSTALLQATSLTLGWTGTLADGRIASAATWNAKQPAGNYITDLTGDVTASGPGSVAATIANNAVTYGKIQDASTTSVLLGSDDTTNDITEITLGTGLTMTGSTLSASSGSGTVTTVSVATANGFAGTVANATTTPAITISTGVTGLLKGNGTAVSAASAGTDYEVPLTFTGGVTRTVNSISVDTTQNITKLSNLTSNGFVKTSGGDGTLGIDTSTYLTGNQTVTLSGAVTGSGATSITTTLANSIVGIANLTATGTPSNTTYLRGDNTWATLPSGAGTVTSVGLSLPTEITVSNSPVTTTGTLTGVWANQTTNKFFAAPNGSTGTPTFRVIATADLGTGSASSSNYLRGDLTWATVSASPAGSTTQVQYNNAGTTDGAANVTIDLTDENLTLLSTNTTSAIAAPSAGLKIWGDNRAGLDQPHFTPTVGVDYWLQPSLGQKVVSQYSFGTSVSGIGNYASSSSAGTTAEVVKTYDATNLLPNYSYRRITTNATTNVSAEFFVNTTGRGPTMGNNVYGGGFKFMVTFGFPTYLSTERIFVGVTSVAAQNATTTDPSAWLNMLGVAKDAADTTLQFMTNAGTGTATKTNTGITPNANDVYRMTLFVPSNSASAYIMLERFTKSAVTIADTSFTGSKLMGGLIVYTHVMVNTAAVASAIQLAIMNQQLEEF